MLASQFPLRFGCLSFLQRAADYLTSPDHLFTRKETTVQEITLLCLVKAFLSPEFNNTGKSAPPELIHAVEIALACANSYPRWRPIQEASCEIAYLCISNCRVGYVRETHFKDMYSLALHAMELPITTGIGTLAVGARLLNTLLTIDKQEGKLEQSGLKFITLQSFRFMSSLPKVSSDLVHSLALLRQYTSKLKVKTPDTAALAELYFGSKSAPSKDRNVSVEQPVSQPSSSVKNLKSKHSTSQCALPTSAESCTKASDDSTNQPNHPAIAKAVNKLLTAMENKSTQDISIALSLLIQLCYNLPLSKYSHCFQPSFSSVVTILHPEFDVNLQKQALKLLNSLVTDEKNCIDLVENHKLPSVLYSCLDTSIYGEMLTYGCSILETLLSNHPLYFNDKEFLQKTVKILLKQELLSNEGIAGTQMKALWCLVKTFLSPQCRNSGKPAIPELIETVVAAMTCAFKYPLNAAIQTQACEIARLSISNCRVGFVRETHFKDMYSLAFRTLSLPPSTSANTLIIGARLLNTLLRIDNNEGALEVSALRFIDFRSFKIIFQNRMSVSEFADCVTILQPFTSELKADTPGITTLAELHAQSLSASSKAKEEKDVEKPSSKQQSSSHPPAESDEEEKPKVNITQSLSSSTPDEQTITQQSSGDGASTTMSKQEGDEKQRIETQAQLKHIDDCLAKAHTAFAENADKEVMFVLQAHTLHQQITEAETLLAHLKKQLSDIQQQLTKVQETRQQLTDTVCQLTEQRVSCLSSLNNL